MDFTDLGIDQMLGGAVSALRDSFLDSLVDAVRAPDGSIDEGKLRRFFTFMAQRNVAFVHEYVAYVVAKAEEQISLAYNKGLDDAATVLKLDAPDDVAPLAKFKRQINKVALKNPFFGLERTGKWWNS